jgi:uncharacterized protein YaiI (UPF0178 family)
MRAYDLPVRIWVDADACPGVVKDILYRAAERARVPLTVVANRDLRVPRSPWIRSMRVGQGFDVADRTIVEEARSGDLVVTADIPLAAEVVKKGVIGLNPRGELYTEENIGEYLAVRNLMSDLRDGGLQTGGPSSYSRADRQAFANALDRILTARAGDRPDPPAD